MSCSICRIKRLGSVPSAPIGIPRTLYFVDLAWFSRASSFASRILSVFACCSAFLVALCAKLIALLLWSSASASLFSSDPILTSNVSTLPVSMSSFSFTSLIAAPQASTFVSILSRASIILCVGAIAIAPSPCAPVGGSFGILRSSCDPCCLAGCVTPCFFLSLSLPITMGGSPSVWVPGSSPLPVQLVFQIAQHPQLVVWSPCSSWLFRFYSLWIYAGFALSPLGPLLSVAASRFVSGSGSGVRRCVPGRRVSAGGGQAVETLCRCPPVFSWLGSVPCSPSAAAQGPAPDSKLLAAILFCREFSGLCSRSAFWPRARRSGCLFLLHLCRQPSPSLFRPLGRAPRQIALSVAEAGRSS